MMITNVQNQLSRHDGYAQLVNAISRNLIEKSPYTVGPLGKVIKVGSSTVLGGVGGSLLGGVAIAFLVSNPAGWVIGTGMGIGACITGGICGFFANRSVENYRKESQKMSEEMKKLVEMTHEIQLEYLKTTKEPVDHVKNMIRTLKDSGYVNRCDYYEFEFNEKKFKTIESWYPKNDGKEVANSAKFAILMSVASLPAEKRPSDRLISNLKDIIKQPLAQPLKNSCNFTLGLLNLGKENATESYLRFSQIPKDSDLYNHAQTAMSQIKDKYPKEFLN